MKLDGKAHGWKLKRNPVVIEAMKEKGIDISMNKPKLLPRKWWKRLTRS